MGDKNNLALDADVRIAGVIAEDHGAFAFRHGDWANEQVVSDLNFSGTEEGLQFAQPPAIEDVPTLDCDNFIPGDGLAGEQSEPMDWAGPHFSFRRKE